MKKCIIISCLLTLLVQAAWTQSAEKQKELIASVKKSSEYIYAEATCETAEDAGREAMKIIRQKINAYVTQQGGKTNANSQPQRIELPRGNMTRVFVYVKKNSLITGGISQSATSNVSQSAPPSLQGSDASARNLNSGRAQSSDRDVAIAELCGIKTVSMLKTALPRMKKEGKILSWASYHELANPENFILVIYDREGNIKAVLSEGRERKNLIKGISDSIRNYKGTGAVGVKLK